jgi:RinA family phage transcriptional activator
LIESLDENNVSLNARKLVEQELRKYHETIKHIELRRQEILYDNTGPDVVGGGRSNIPGNPTLRKATALDSDRKLRNLTNVVEAIEYVWTGLDDTKKQLVKLYYWTRPQTLTLEGVAQHLHIGLRTAKRYRYEILRDIAVQLGWR